MDPVLAMKLARPDDEDVPLARIAPVTLDEVLGTPDETCVSPDLEAAINREIFGILVTP